MNESIFEQIQECAEYLRLELTSQEIAALSLNQGIGEQGIQAISDVLNYLRDKKK